MTSLSFVEDKINKYIDLKVNESKFISLVLYVDDILLAFKTFHMKDLGEASFILGIKIHRDRSHHLLGLS